MTRKRAAKIPAAAPRDGAKGVPVRVLKDRISEYLQAVEMGASVVITNHGRAVADLVPHRSEGPAPAVRKATRAWGSVRLARTGRGPTDIVALMLEERGRR